MLLLTALAVQAQTRDSPRLPWGDPDLEGTWTNATLTLLQRPAELGATRQHVARAEASKQRPFEEPFDEPDFRPERPKRHVANRRQLDSSRRRQTIVAPVVERGAREQR